MFMECVLKKVYELNLLLHKNKVQPFHLRAVIRELKIYLFELVYNQRTKLLLDKPNFQSNVRNLFEKLSNVNQKKAVQLYRSYIIQLLSELNKRMPHNLDFMASYEVVDQEVLEKWSKRKQRTFRINAENENDPF